MSYGGALATPMHPTTVYVGYVAKAQPCIHFNRID